MNDIDLIKELIDNNYVKRAIGDIAEKYKIPKSELKKFYTLTFFSEIAEDIDLKKLTEINIQEIEKMISEDKKQKFKFIKTEFKNILEKCLYIAVTNGFKVNINNIDSGIMTSNAGDSAEFIFVARAILAGFNCSSVDVRSSRYDAIIDYNNKLLRVQIKGISTGNNISFKDRDRGGQGIDYTNERNRGKRITSQDCDIFVAVDKQVGICYIIPMDWADRLDDNHCVNIKLEDIYTYKENWDVIKQKVL
ncbi:group I intron-associated PD-(D/E)XK endonuclease [Geminocystis herdmanii]|uniref:group I intron-associated PD-(D/E)XK endonuclease n=1 Tax=Geminocystis herdmanii TaxID=669359 RepID=UPI00034B424C|nr:group I intron-associated PD-(D/E)XK endonuclease [Geminocystis herdmanii]